ncbi:MAG: hypothetical protein ACK56I_25755, partial [bacterium]
MPPFNTGSTENEERIQLRLRMTMSGMCSNGVSPARKRRMPSTSPSVVTYPFRSLSSNNRNAINPNTSVDAVANTQAHATNTGKHVQASG